MKSKVDYIKEDDGVQIPIEIKKGQWNGNKPRKNDEAQLLCEALLLEEHFSMKYNLGYVLYVGSKHEYKVNITPQKRRYITRVINEIRSYMRSGKIPKIKHDENKCRKCSLGLYCTCE